MKTKMLLVGSISGNFPVYDEKFKVFSLTVNATNPIYLGRLTVVEGKIKLDILKSTTLIEGYEEGTVKELKKELKFLLDPEYFLNNINIQRERKVRYLENLEKYKENPDAWLFALSRLYKVASSYKEREDLEFPVYESNFFLSSLKNKK